MTDLYIHNTQIEGYRLYTASPKHVLLITSFAFICRLSYVSTRTPWPDWAKVTLTGFVRSLNSIVLLLLGRSWRRRWRSSGSSMVRRRAPVFAVDAAGLSTGLGGGGGGLPAYVGGGGLLAYVGGGGWVA